MKAFYGSRFSPNMTKTPEGFLICHNVPIARTGWYEYLAQELGFEGNKAIKVYRSPEEVFSKSAIASFEGKPITDEHPPELLTPNNSKIFVKGTTQNVRQDTKEPDLLIADLMIYESVLIDEISQGKREVSCGYECSYKDNGDGTYSQVQICGNHVAVVEAGRAGDRVAIKDSKNKDMKGAKKTMGKKDTKKSIFGLGLKHFFADAEPEEIADALSEFTGKENDEDPMTEAKPAQSNDEGNADLAALNAKMDRLIDLLSGTAQKPKDNQPEDVIDEMINALEGKKENTVGDEEESVTIPAEEMDEDIPEGIVQSQEEMTKNPLPNADSAAILKTLKAMKPIIASIPDEGIRKKACDSLMAQFKEVNKVPQNKNTYAEIMKSQRSNAAARQKAADAEQVKLQQIENGYKKLNPHCKEEK